MRKMLLTAGLACVLATLSSCGTQLNATSSITAINGEWRITTVNGRALQPKPGEKKAFIGFDVKDNRLYGNTGCNNIVGSIQADAKKGKMSFSQSGSTRMMCADMATEQAVLGAMAEVEKYEISKDGRLQLKSAKGNTVMTLEKGRK